MVGILQEGDVCNGENVGLLRYNTARRMLLFCDGQNWKVCATPSPLWCTHGGEGRALYHCVIFYNVLLSLHKVCNVGKQLSTSGRRNPWEVKLQCIGNEVLLPNRHVP